MKGRFIMKKVAVFGKPGSGKSSLSIKLSLVTGIPLVQLDSLIYDKNGERIERSIYNTEHTRILETESWIIDGFGPIGSFYERLDTADTLIYIDLPYYVSYWLVTKRLFKSVWSKPEGWPDGSSVLKGTIESYKVLKLCPKFWNDSFNTKLRELSQNKTLHVIRSIKELNRFVESSEIKKPPSV